MPKPEFEVYILNAEGERKAEEIAEMFSDLLANLELVVPDGRDLSIVKTKLQEACFFAKRGMAQFNREV